MSHQITVYSKPDCVQCDSTYMILKRNKTEYQTFDVSADSDALGRVKELGYLAAPVVVVSGTDGNVVNHWSGFRPGLINEYA